MQEGTSGERAGTNLCRAERGDFGRGRCGGILSSRNVQPYVPLAHNIFHFASGVIALWAGLGKSADGPRRFGLIFGAIYTLVAIAGFAGLRDLGPIQLDLNTHFNFIHLGVGLLSLAAGFASAKPS